MTRFAAQATAVIRRTGSWSAWLGPEGFLERLRVRGHRAIARELERFLGLLATCLGASPPSALKGPATAALANAVADATGKRLRDLPLTSERVKAAMGNP